MVVTFFSIIIPTYNSEGSIKIAIESLLNQTFGDFEILLIDGLSTDNTVAIAESFSDPRIKIHVEPDKGVYDAMNRGILSSRGSWLYFMGSDDRLYDKAVLQGIFNRIASGDCQVVYGNVFSSKFGGLYDGEFDKEKILDRNICHQAIFFNKRIFERTGLFDLKYKIYADWDHNFKWMLDDSIKKRFFNCVVAEYGVNGMSSLSRDDLFDGNKLENYYRLARSSARPAFKINLLRAMANTKRTQGKLISYFKYLVMHYIARVTAHAS